MLGMIELRLRGPAAENKVLTCVYRQQAVVASQLSTHNVQESTKARQEIGCCSAGKAVMWSLRVAVGALLLIALLIVIVTFQVRRVRLPGEEIVPAGRHRNAAIYVPMRDGTQIAVDIWLPPDLAVGERVPVLMCTTRYWRAVQYTWIFRLLVGLHLLDPEMSLYHQGIFFNRQHFAIIFVDARGTGASSGNRITEYSPDEIADLGEIAEWALKCPVPSNFLIKA